MSAQQGSYACHITVDGQTADVLREEVQDGLGLQPRDVRGLPRTSPPSAKKRSPTSSATPSRSSGPSAGSQKLDGAERFEIPLTAGLIEQLHKRRDDLDATNLDLLDDFERAETDEHAAEIEAEMTTNRRAMQTLDRLFTDYDHAITA